VESDQEQDCSEKSDTEKRAREVELLEIHKMESRSLEEIVEEEKK
jgi:hypothetical protein